MSDDNKMKKQLLAAHQHLMNQGMNPTDIAREQRHELMVPKLALVGVFQTLETFCGGGKNNVMSTVGPLNTRNLLLFFGALKKTIELGEKVVIEYQGAQASLQAMEQALAFAEAQQASEETEDDSEEISSDDGDDEHSDETNHDTKEDSEDDISKAFDIRKLN